MANFIKTDSCIFQELCEIYKRFDIPNFQRPYSWKNKQLQEFFNSIIENEKVYFIGNIVALDGQEGRPLKIIDGQQRLTTIFLLLMAIRDLFEDIKPKDDQERILIDQTGQLINEHLSYKDLRKVPAVIYKRLNLGKEKYQYVFNKIIEKRLEEINLSEIGDNEKRIINNYKILKNLVLKYISNSKLDKLEEVYEKTVSLQVILIICKSDNEIYRIFEGFNSTGLGLSVADLVKNSVLMGSKNDRDIQTQVESLWLDAEDLFEKYTNRFPKFLRHQWISENGYVLMSNLFHKIKHEKIEHKTSEEILEYVSSLTQDAKIYMGMIYKEYESHLKIDEDILNSLKKFRFLRNDQIYEILLSYYKIYQSKIIKKSTLQKYLRQIWIFVLRTRFISVNPSEYETIFAQHCNHLSNAKNSDEISKYFNIFIEKLKKLVSDDNQFIENFVSDVKYNNDNKLIVEAISEIMMHQNTDIQLRNPEIEHILPQEPKKWNLTKAEVREYVNNIGNLTLLFEGDNKEAANDIFDKKALVYKKNSFILNKEIVIKWEKGFKSDWKETIKDRGVDLATRLSKIWKI